MPGTARKAVNLESTTAATRSSTVDLSAMEPTRGHQPAMASGRKIRLGAKVRTIPAAKASRFDEIDNTLREL